MLHYGRLKAGNYTGLRQCYRPRLLVKAAGQGCLAKAQYAESMVKLDNNATF
jgi:hypothetical protein